MYLMYYGNALCFGNSSNTPYTRKEYLRAGTYQLTIPSDITELVVTGCGGGAGGVTLGAYNQIGVAGNSGAFVVKEKVPVIPGSVIDIIVGDGGKHAFYSNDGDGASRFRVSDGTHGFVIVEYGTSTLYSAEY